MKVAEVRYTGRKRRDRRRGPSGEEYHFHRSQEGATPLAVSSVKDAEYFAETGVHDVEWTGLGEVVKSTDGPLTSVEAMLDDMVYQEKQRLASKLGTKASGKEEEIDERLKPRIEDLQEQMENQ